MKRSWVRVIAKRPLWEWVSQIIPSSQQASGLGSPGLRRRQYYTNQSLPSGKSPKSLTQPIHWSILTHHIIRQSFRVRTRYIHIKVSRTQKVSHTQSGYLSLCMSVSMLISTAPLYGVGRHMYLYSLLMTWSEAVRNSYLHIDITALPAQENHCGWEAVPPSIRCRQLPWWF